VAHGTPWNQAGREGPYDDVVIGSGMGGMTTAALLAKLGRRVLVLEQHYVPGGYTHVFRRKGFAWDVGVHAVGEITHHSLPGRLLTRLTDGRLAWASLGEAYDRFTWPGDFHLEFANTPQQHRANLVAAFPEHEAVIDRYLALVREVASGMRGYYMVRVLPKGVAGVTERLFGSSSHKHFSRRTADVLAELTDDPRLRAVLAAQWGYYGSPPSRSSFAIQALVVKHFLHGGYYPVGGSGQIAATLLQTVADAGGWTRVRADVEQILIEGGRAVGVRLAGGEEIRCQRVFSAAGVQSTASRLLPEEVSAGWTRSVTAHPAASAHLCLYLGFEGDIREAGASAANEWFYETWDLEEEAWDVEDPASRAGCLYCSFPSLKDPQHDPGPRVRHTGEVVTFVPYETFARWKGTQWKRRPEEYDAFKADIERRMLDQFFEHMPGLRDKLVYAELSTPLSTEHFVRPMAGSIYGIEPTPERFDDPWLRPRSPIPGLFFSGSEVASVGVVGAMMGGVLAAVAAEPVAGMRYLRGT
jgi:all-trans-retinol 13,14-reductase